MSYRIAMVGPFGFRPKKTMRSRAFRIARELVKRGHTVQMIMPPWHTPEEGGRRWTEDGVSIQYVPVDGGAIRIVPRMIRATAAFNPDIIHCFKPIAYSAMVGRYFYHRSRNKRRVLFDMDDWEGWGGWNELTDYSRPAKWLIGRQEQHAMRHCHALTVASRALETIALSHAVPPHNLHYLPNGSGIDLDHPPSYEQSRITPTLLLYSRLFEFDVARLVEIVWHVHQAIPDLRLLVIGASLHEGDGDQFRHLLAEKNLTHLVEDVGWVDEDKLPGMMAQAHVGIYLMDDTLLNRAKCPVKLADMLQVGLPVVGERVGQVGEYIDHGRTGFLHPTGDILSIAQSVITLLTDQKKAAAFGTAAHHHYQQKFSWGKAAERVEAVYKSL